MQFSIAMDVDQFSTDKICAIVSCIRTFIASADHIPGLMEGTTTAGEISSRLKQENK